ncbi:Cyclic nucleotide-binding domain protein [Planctomycetes bacterium Pan216]|uniref:Cyclic nucleotide-binding domain protein n=2 Tax=Kolteria novifilia TaxID=2527975 RepID=A0A518B620_9BACT|nr:Cyclic nucleotide-binding domain protein [Planctomycetes bacterium Pan216]
MNADLDQMLEPLRQSTRLFDGIEGEDAQRVISWLAVRQLGPGDALVAEGAGPGGCDFVLEGTVEIVIGDHQDAISIRTLEAPTVIGEVSLLTGQERMANVYCVTETLTAHLPAVVFDEHVEQGDPVALRLGLNLGRVASERLHWMRERIQDLPVDVAEELDDSPMSLDVKRRLDVYCKGFLG